MLVTQSGPTCSSSRVESPGLDRATQRLGVTPLVTLVNFSGKAQIDCVRFSANGLLAVSVSSLFNDVWGGSVKLFCRQSSGEFMETKHIDLVGGNSSSLLFLKTLKLKEPEIKKINLADYFEFGKTVASLTDAEKEVVNQMLQMSLGKGKE